MYKGDKKKMREDKVEKAGKKAKSALNLKPNEAYEPGFGKYTLTESELRAGEINRREVEKFSGKKAEEQNSKAGTDDTRIAQQPGGSMPQSQFNSPGVSHYPEESENKEEQERRMRDENTNMHNNW